MSDPKKIVVVLSGGMDSTTLMYDLAHQGHEVLAVTIDYGQRHRKEVLAAKKVGDLCGVRHWIVPVPSLSAVLTNSALTNPSIPVPEGHYEDESMKATVVPNRNMILLAIAIGICVNEGFDAVAYGAHAGDHAIYPDCRDEFAKAMAQAAALCHYTPIELLRPYVGITKAAIVSIGKDLQVPYHETWTCYKGGEKHCGKCGTCVERIEAFQLAGVTDPVEYETVTA